MTIEYLDLKLTIERAGMCYRAQIIDSPGGQASTVFNMPFDQEDLDSYLARLKMNSPNGTEEAQKFGTELFQSIFAGQMLGCLRSSMDEAERRSMGLRISLRLNDVPELVGIPWEHLYNTATAGFLSLSSNTPLVRYVQMPRWTRALAVKPPLRVLAMVSNPHDYAELNAESEWQKLQDAIEPLQDQGLMIVERLEKATLPSLQAKLRRNRYHIFYFIGHGGYDESNQESALVFENSVGAGRLVNGRYLGTLLQDERTLQLAVLNACEAARSSQHDPTSSVAQALVLQGVPAVIGMQFPISDAAAICMTQEFFRAIADNYPVDAALAEARKAIFTSEQTIEWGTPVLYMRGQDGHIFDIESIEAASAAAESKAPYKLVVPPPAESIIMQQPINQQASEATHRQPQPETLTRSPQAHAPQSHQPSHHQPEQKPPRAHVRGATGHINKLLDLMASRVSNAFSLQTAGLSAAMAVAIILAVISTPLVERLLTTGSTEKPNSVALERPDAADIHSGTDEQPLVDSGRNTNIDGTIDADQSPANALNAEIAMANQNRVAENRVAGDAVTQQLPEPVGMSDTTAQLGTLAEQNNMLQQDVLIDDKQRVAMNTQIVGRTGLAVKKGQSQADTPDSQINSNGEPALISDNGVANINTIPQALVRLAQSQGAESKPGYHFAIFGINGKSEPERLAQTATDGSPGLDQTILLKQLLDLDALLISQESDQNASQELAGDVIVRIDFDKDVQEQVRQLFVNYHGKEMGLLPILRGEALLLLQQADQLVAAVEISDLTTAQEHAKQIVNIIVGAQNASCTEDGDDSQVGNLDGCVGLLSYLDEMGYYAESVGRMAQESEPPIDLEVKVERLLDSIQSLEAQLIQLEDLALEIAVATSLKESAGPSLQLNLLTSTFLTGSFSDDSVSIKSVTEQFVEIARSALIY